MSFDLGNGPVTLGGLFELIDENRRPTGRLGRILEVLQDGDADVEMLDGKPPHIVKWKQIKPISAPSQAEVEVSTDPSIPGQGNLKLKTIPELQAEYMHWTKKLNDAKSWGAAVAAAREFQQDALKELKLRGAWVEGKLEIYL